jgi:hypothetical protein
VLTHEFFMLGERRAGATTALQHFERKGLIETARGADSSSVSTASASSKRQRWCRLRSA